MRIKFKAGDPRAGTIAQMDSIRGQELIEAGAAVKVKDDGSDAEVATNSGDADTTADTADTGTTARKTAAKSTTKAKAK
jgi:hypothetical protein